jgi:hypothetical protein
MNFGDVYAPPFGLYSSHEDGRAQHRQKRRGQMNVSIRVKGHLDPIWQQWLEGLQIVHETDGTSTLFGPLQDQPALYGLLTKIGRLNLTLLSLESNELTHKE